MPCNSQITAGFLVNCSTLPLAGLESDIVLINYDDIDKTATTFDVSNDLIITNLVLKRDKTGYLLAGVKQSNGKNYELVVGENTYNKWKHAISGRVLNPSAQNKKQMENLANAKIVAVVHQKWKGENNESAFEVLGYNQSMMLREATNNSSENDNTIVFSLSSEEGYEESRLPYNVLETDYATTLTAFNNLFAS